MDLATVQAVKAQDFSCGSFPEGSHQSGDSPLLPNPIHSPEHEKGAWRGKPHKLWGTRARAEDDQAFCFWNPDFAIISSSWGLRLAAASCSCSLTAANTVLLFCVGNPPPSTPRRKGLHSLSSYLRMNTNISFTPEAAAVLTDFLHQKLGDHLGSCKESAGCTANGSASVGCLPKRLRTLASSNRDLSYLYR